MIIPRGARKRNSAQKLSTERLFVLGRGKVFWYSFSLGIRQFSKLTFHSLRHSFVSGLANAGVAQETRMLMTDHGSVAVQRDFTHLGFATKRNSSR
jgi:hypothetical protein